MGGVCGIGSIKGRLSPIGSLQGALSIPIGGSMDCDIYEGEYNIAPNNTVQVLPTANKLLKHDIVIEANSGGLPEGSEMATEMFSEPESILVRTSLLTVLMTSRQKKS